MKLCTKINNLVGEATIKDQEKFMISAENLLDEIKDIINAMNQGYVRSIDKKLVIKTQKNLSIGANGLVDLLNFYNKKK